MRIAGEWLLGEDGFTRPVLRGYMIALDGNRWDDLFLVDSGADRTVLSAAFWRRLRLPADPTPAGIGLMGIGGLATFVLISTAVEWERDDGRFARVRGQFAAFTDPAATDFSVLGRDVLDNFDVILSRRRNEVLLLAPNHSYSVTSP